MKVWTPPTGTDYSKQVWAPELHFLAGKWYIYVAASDGNNSTHRMQVLERDAADPFGSFVYKGKIAASTDRWAIDGTAFEWQGAMYFVWSGWPGSTDGQQNLYIAQMDTPWSLSTESRLVEHADVRVGAIWTADQRRAGGTHPRRHAEHHLFGERLLDETSTHSAG